MAWWHVLAGSSVAWYSSVTVVSPAGMVAAVGVVVVVSVSEVAPEVERVTVSVLEYFESGLS